MMYKIVISSQKGGSGKTTLCRILSAEAARSKKGQAAQETTKLWAFIKTYLENQFLTPIKQEGTA